METLNLVSTGAANMAGAKHQPTFYKTIAIDGLNIFYREAGSRDKPTLLLLHGFPTSSHMFRNLMNALSPKYHLIAPDLPGFGNSSMPSADAFEYTFDNLANVIQKWIGAMGLEKYSLYVMDYGAPVGFRIATRMPQRVQALFIQNGNAYKEGLSPFWEPIKAFWATPQEQKNIDFIRSLLTLEATKWQYLTGTKDPLAISPDNWIIDQARLDRPGNQDIQIALFKSYQTNLDRYPEWQAYFRNWQPPALITWGKGDEIFPASGAYAYQQHLQNVELHFLDTGHFALEEEWVRIASLMDKFLASHGIS